MRWKKSRRIPKWIAGEKVTAGELLEAYRDQTPLIVAGRFCAAAVWANMQFAAIMDRATNGYVKRAVLNPEWLEQEEYLAERRADRLERAARVEP